ncbi:hypothetical protein [Thalassotalea ganghwensis]
MKKASKLLVLISLVALVSCKATFRANNAEPTVPTNSFEQSL